MARTRRTSKLSEKSHGITAPCIENATCPATYLKIQKYHDNVEKSSEENKKESYDATYFRKAVARCSDNFLIKRRKQKWKYWTGKGSPLRTHFWAIAAGDGAGGSQEERIWGCDQKTRSGHFSKCHSSRAELPLTEEVERDKEGGRASSSEQGGLQRKVWRQRSKTGNFSEGFLLEICFLVQIPYFSND